MADDEIDLLAIDRGSITAPAGCGKTHMIVQTLGRHSGPKPILVLTHTNAGVAALRGRLRLAKIPPSAYRLATIDGWAMRLTSMFPVRSGIAPAVVRRVDRRSDYPRIREAAVRLLTNRSILGLVSATYARLLVDEYQDCSSLQHSLVKRAADGLPTCILGDPMQAIFDFGPDPLPDWDKEVCAFFPLAGSLGTPYRWINAGQPELGHWLLAARDLLHDGGRIDLGSAPDQVRWVRLDGAGDRQKLYGAALTQPPGGLGSVLVLADSRNPEGQRLIASQTPGAVMVEAVDLRDFVEFAESYDVGSTGALSRLLEFGQRLMTHVESPQLLRRLETLRDGRSRKAPNEAESAGLEFLQAPSHSRAAALLTAIRSQPHVRVHRPWVLQACVAALRASGTGGTTFGDQAVRARERYRMMGRQLPRRAVGSTLLLKGLEAEVVVILDTSGLNAKNLYVAMTRGSKLVVLCSPTQIVGPR